jgi:hypothetical protein
MVNIYDLSKSDFDKQVINNNESTNTELTKLLKNVPETEYNIIMRILKRTNSTPINYYSQSYADFMSNITTLDNDGYVKLFKELLNAYEISTKDVLSMNETRLVIFNKLRDAQNVYTEKFKDGKIKIEDATADNFDEGEEEVEVDKNTTKTKTKKSSSKQTSKVTKETEIKEQVVESKEKKKKEPEPKESEPTEPEPKESEPKESKPKESKPKESKPKESKPKESKPKEPEPELEEPMESEPKEKGKRVKGSKK